MTQYLKSPFNYIGNKYKLLPQLKPLFPTKIENFYDIFCGGLDISVNTEAERIIANDINHFLIEIHQMFKQEKIDILLDKIDQVIADFKLSKDDKKSYYDFREYYNKNKNPLFLYVLMCFSFNYQFRFNANLDYNNTAGTHRSSFNPALKKRVVEFSERVKQIEFTNENFRNIDFNSLAKGDFVYCDPPYRASVGSYNDGKRGFDGWCLKDDLDLFSILDGLDSQGVKFGISNVISNNGITNLELLEWSKLYNVHDIVISYNNSSYQRGNKNETKEIFVTNY